MQISFRTLEGAEKVSLNGANLYEFRGGFTFAVLMSRRGSVESVLILQALGSSQKLEQKAFVKSS